MMSLQHPWLLLLLPLPWLIRAKAQTGGQSIYFPLFQSCPELLQATPLKARFSWVFILVWGLLTLGASNPQWLGKTLPQALAGRNILLAVDVSESMALPDFSLGQEESSRLNTIQALASQFIDKRKGDRLGLLFFGSQAYLRTPLTFDRQTVKDALDDLTTGLAGPRTAIGDALVHAVQSLKDLPEKSRLLILMTDGANNEGVTSPKEAIRLAKKFHVKVHTIGIGSDRLIVQTLLGPQAINPSQTLDEGLLKTIAEETGGTFFRAKNAAGLQKIYQDIHHMEPTKERSKRFRAKRELYPECLALAFLLCCLATLFRRSAA